MKVWKAAAAALAVVLLVSVAAYPTLMQERRVRDCRVDLNLGLGERERQAETYRRYGIPLEYLRGDYILRWQGFALEMYITNDEIEGFVFRNLWTGATTYRDVEEETEYGRRFPIHAEPPGRYDLTAIQWERSGEARHVCNLDGWFVGRWWQYLP